MSHPDQAFGDKTYSQFGEDLIILNVFYKLGIEKGSYFDVGAHHPYNISNTALLYERGHSGICVEANPNHIEAFNRHRGMDTILNVGVGPVAGELEFFMVDDFSGRNSFDYDTVLQFIKLHPEFKLNKVVPIKVVTLDNLYAQYGVPDLLCIDIEGLDYPVLQTMLGRPKIICVENDGKVGYFDNLLKLLKYDKIFNTIGNGIYIHESCAGHRN